MAISKTVAPRRKETGAADPVITRLAEEDTVPWWRKPNLRVLYFLMFPACMGIELTSGFDSQLINALQIVPHWISYFNHPHGSLKGIISAAYSLGAILSLPFIPIVNDKWGRRGSIFAGSVVMVIGAIIQGLSQNVAMYIVARLILGFGIPTCIVSGSSLIGELGHPKERPVLTSLFNVSYFFGQIAAAGITFGTNSIASDWAWRIPSFLQMAPSIMQICFIYLLPESPRWLVAHDRLEEAEAILVKYHAEGDHTSEFVKGELEQINAAIHLEKEAAKQTWLDLLKTSGMRRRTLISTMMGLFTQWSGNTLISYYFGDLLKKVGIRDSILIQKLNVANACWSFVCAFISSLLVPKFKRRSLFLYCTISMLVCYTAWTISMEKAEEASDSGHKNRSASIANVFFIFLFPACYNVGYNALTYTYLVEIWPYLERSRGIAVFQLWGRLAAFFTTFVNPIGLDNIKWKWLIVYCVFLVYEILFVWFFFPETAGRTLEELTFLFEDKDLAIRANEAVEKAVHHDDLSFGEKHEISTHAEAVHKRA